MEAEHKINRESRDHLAEENKIGENAELVPFLPDENDDITEYITDSSFEALKKRFAAAEEDQSIRDEDFNPLVAGKASKKNAEDELRSAPSFKKDIIDPETPIALAHEFGSADSEFDNDAISFGAIDIDLNSIGSLVGNDDKNEIDKSEEYDLNTRVIYVDEDADDGIKRNTDTEVTDVFFPD